MSTIKVDTWQDRAGTQEFYACRAWVNFNGTGTVAIRESGNVSSITDNGTGDYTVNFTTAMPDANYGTQVSWGMVAVTVTVILGTVSIVAPATGSRRFGLNAPNGSGYDMAEINVSVFR
jgi:hypothetical protein